MQAAFTLGVPLPTFDKYVARYKLTVRLAGPYGNVGFFDEDEIVRLKQELSAQAVVAASVQEPQQSASATQVNPPDLRSYLDSIKLILRLVDDLRPISGKARNPYQGAFTLQGASGVSGLSASTLRRDIKDRRLKAKKIDGVWRIARPELYSYLKREWNRST